MWRNTGIVPRVVLLGGGDDEGGDGGVGLGHPQSIRVWSQRGGGDRYPREKVNHGVVVVPEHKLRGTNGVSELTRDGNAVPQVDVFLPGAQYVCCRLGNSEPR